MDKVEIGQAVEARQNDLVEMRRDFHRHPELAFEESRTAGIIAERLQSSGLEVSTGIAKTGVVGMLRGGKPGKTIMVRADIDALPIIEEESAPSEYRSQTQGKMHACGHDGHTAIGITMASLLAERRNELAGNIKFLFQPAEEIVGGAKPMIDEGVMQGIDAVVGLHLSSNLPAGMVGMRAGPSMANVDSIKLTVRGRGGHGSQPEAAIDSVMIACNLVTTLQTIVSREISPANAAVLSFGTINGGFASNIIAPEVVLTGTVRSYLPEVREKMISRIEEIAIGVGKSLRAEVKFEVVYSCPAVVNNEEMTKLVWDSATKTLGADKVIETPQIMGSDDMSLFLQAAPGCYFFVGSGKEDGSSAPHHHPGFDIVESSLPVGVRVMTQAVIDYLNRN
jgi:amidohydrolase